MSIEVTELERKQNELALKQIAGKAHNIQSNPSGPVPISVSLDRHNFVLFSHF
ncbi:MAG: hypothetical protein WCC79_01215 [Nitrososphaeraceae archaeon]